MNYKTFVFLFAFTFLPISAGCQQNPHVQWTKFSFEQLEAAKNSNQPAIIYFYAAWCPQCYRLKESTFQDPRVIDALGGFVRLKADLSFQRSQKIMEISRHFQINGVPTIILFNSAGRETIRIPGFIDPDQFLEVFRRYEAYSNSNSIE